MENIHDIEALELGMLAGATTPVVAPTAYQAIEVLNGTTVPFSRIDKDLLLVITKYLIENNYENIEKVMALYNQVYNQDQANQARIEQLNTRIKSLYFSLKNAQAIEANIPSYINQNPLDFTALNLFDEANTNCLITDKILGIANAINKSTDYSNMTLTTYPLAQTTIVLADSMGVTDGYISASNINTGNPFIIGADSPYWTQNRQFLFTIYRPNMEELNQIDISLTEAHIIQISSSKDNITYTPVYTDVVYVQAGIIPIAPNTDPYLRITLYKNSDLKSTLVNGKYRYSVNFNHLYISGVSINDAAYFQTNPIDLALTTVNGVSLDVCDNYSNNNVDISYFVDFNNANNWQEIRPVGKIKQSKIAIPTFIKFNDYYTNKIIQITGQPVNIGTSQVPSLQYLLTMEQDFITSNQIRVFNRIVPTDFPNWNKGQTQYSVIGILNESKTIQLNPNYPLYINSTPQIGSGTITLGPGVYNIAIDFAGYLFLFDPSVYTVISISDTGLYTIQNKSTGSNSTIQDTQWPYNLKTNVEAAFDFLFFSELLDSSDYTLYNNGTDYFITTPKQYENLYVAYRLYSSDATGMTIRLKGTYQSINNITIPYTDRIIIRSV